MKFSIKNFFSKGDQIRSFLRIWSHLLKKSLMENFNFCAVLLLSLSSLKVSLKLLLFFHPTNFFYFSGETAFTNVSQYLGYSKNPLIRRIKNLDKNLPITVLYGKDSWVADLFYFPILESELFDHCYCSTKIIYDAGHHIYSDNFNDFNRYVNGACNVKVSSRDFTSDIYSLRPIETEQYTLEYSDTIQLVTSI